MKTLIMLAFISVFFSTDILAVEKNIIKKSSSDRISFNKKIDKKDILILDDKYRLLCKFDKCRVIYK